MPPSIGSLAVSQSPRARAMGRSETMGRLAVPQSGGRQTTGGQAYGGMELHVRAPRRFAIGERSAHFDTLFGLYIDQVSDPSRAKQKDPEIHNRMRQDLQILGSLRVRQLATIQLTRQWIPADDTDEAKKAAAQFAKWFDGQYRPSEMLLHMLDAVLDGLTVQEMVWRVYDEDWTYGLDRCFPVYKDRFVFSKDGKLCLLTRENLFWGESVHPWQFLQHTYNAGGGSYSNPMDEGRQYWGQGCEDNLYPNYYFKTVVLNLATRWLQRLSSGVLVARYPYRNADAKNIVTSLIEAYQEDEELAFPSGEDWGIDIKEATKAPADTYLQFIEYFDKQIAKCLLGTTLITDPGEIGSQSLGEVHERTTFGRITEFDRIGLEETINRNMVPVMGQLNKIPRNLWPVFGFALDVQNASSEVLDAFIKLQQLGFDVSAEMITDETGFRQPQPGEKILQAKSTAEGAFDLAGAGLRQGQGSPLGSLDLTSTNGLSKFRSIVHRSADHRRGLETYQLAASVAGGKHTHTATLDRHGNGETNRGPDGHGHEVRGWRVLANNEAAHTHEILVRNGEVERVVKMLCEAA